MRKQMERHKQKKKKKSLSSPTCGYRISHSGHQNRHGNDRSSYLQLFPPSGSPDNSNRPLGSFLALNGLGAQRGGRRGCNATRERCSIPKGGLDAADIVVLKIPLGRLILAHGDTFPRQPEVGRIGSLIEDKDEGREMALPFSKSAYRQ